jgi:hypothetical protein
VDYKDTTVAAGSELFINHTKQFRIIYRSVTILQPVVHFRPSVELPVALNFRFEAVFTETEAQKDFGSGHLCCFFYTYKSTLKAFSYLLFHKNVTQYTILYFHLLPFPPYGDFTAISRTYKHVCSICIHFRAWICNSQMC